MFGVKDPILRGLRTSVVYKFLCEGCNASYVGETSRYLSTRVREHMVSDRTTHIFRHLPIYIISHNIALFVLRSVSTSQITLPLLFNLKSKKLSIFNEKPTLDHQLYHVNLKLPCKRIHCSVIIVCFVQSAFCYIHFKFKFVLCIIQN